MKRADARGNSMRERLQARTIPQASMHGQNRLFFNNKVHVVSILYHVDARGNSTSERLQARTIPLVKHAQSKSNI